MIRRNSQTKAREDKPLSLFVSLTLKGQFIILLLEEFAQVEKLELF